jgi:hypothetical protein
MNDKVSKKEILVFVGIFTLMLGSLVYGFFVVGVGKMPEQSPAPLSCWDKYKDVYPGEKVMELCDEGNNNE